MPISYDDLRTIDFDYQLPSDRIAQEPTPGSRDHSKLLVYNRQQGVTDHTRFDLLPSFFCEGDLLLLNNTRVIPARMRGEKIGSGGQIEMLLTESEAPSIWWALLRPGKRVRQGTRILLHLKTGFPSSITATVLEKNAEGHVKLQFEGTSHLLQDLDALGEIPLPPYIDRSEHPEPEDAERYQTVYASLHGSVAAPTAGLHFTPELLRQLATRGIQTAPITLHIGLGTFAPMKVDRLQDHQMHSEGYHVPAETLTAIRRTKAAGRRVVAVGTTSLRTLESIAQRQVDLSSSQAISGRTQLFI